MIKLFPNILIMQENKALKQSKKKKNSTANNVQFAMSCIKSRSTRHAKKQKNISHNEEKNQSIDTVPKITQIIELVDKDIKTTICKCTYMLTTYPQGHKYTLMLNPLGQTFVYMQDRSQDTHFFYYMAIQLTKHH